MASQTLFASSWVSIDNAADNNTPWTGISSAVSSNNDVYVLSSPWLSDFAHPGNLLATQTPTLRATFGAFSLPPTDIVTSLSAIVRVKQKTTPVDGGAIRMVSIGGIPISTTLTTNYQDVMVPFSSLPTVAVLNAGGYIVDTIAEAIFGPLVGPFFFGIPDIAIDSVSLTATTVAAGGSNINVIEQILSIIGSGGVNLHKNGCQ